MSFSAPSPPKVPKVTPAPDPADTDARSAAAAEALRRRSAMGRASNVLAGGRQQGSPVTAAVELLGR